MKNMWLRGLAGILALLFFVIFIVGIFVPVIPHVIPAILFLFFLKIAKIPFITKFVSGCAVSVLYYIKKRTREWKKTQETDSRFKKWLKQMFNWIRLKIARFLKWFRSWR